MQHCSSGKKGVFNTHPQTESDGADVTSKGRPFQICVPAIRNALRPISVRFYTEFVFLSPFEGGGGLGATYNDHLRLIGKRVINFLLLIKLFFARCYH